MTSIVSLMAPKLNKTRVSIFILTLIIAISVYPGKTALEGDQRNLLSPAERTDNWGFLTVFIYGEWPNLFGNWRYTLILFQLFMSVLGFLLLTDDLTFRNVKQFCLFYLLFFVSVMFSIQLWRDSSLYSFSLFGFGVINFAHKRTGQLKVMLFLIGGASLIFASMFKPFLSLAIVPLLYWLLWQKKGEFSKKAKLLKVAALSIFILAPTILNSNFSSLMHLKRVYPEQQPIVLDLAMNYCWGTSEAIRNSAESSLTTLVRPNYPIETVCAATNPFRWDDLHQDPKTWLYSSPISRLTGERAKSEVSRLISNWLNLIWRNPVDWIQVRLLFLGPVLFMSNSFVSENTPKSELNFVQKLNDSSWKLLYVLVSSLDKMRITSLFFLLCLQVFLFYRFFTASKESGYNVNLDLFFSIFSSACILVLGIVTFLAPNGRYILPYVLLNYMMLLRTYFIKNGFIKSTS